jgi:hypothetical protein
LCGSVSVGDSHEGPLKNRGGSCLKPAKNTKRRHTSILTQSMHTQHGPRRRGPRGPARHPLEQGPPRSRVHAPSNEIRLA